MIIQELNLIQKTHSYLPADALQDLSRRLNVPLYRLHGLASFYPHFRLQPPPEVDLRVCRDMACALRGADDLQAIARTAADASPLTDVQVGATACLGQCDGAPAITVNDQVYTEASAQRIVSLLETLAAGRTLRRQRFLPPDTRFACDPYDGSSTYDALRGLLRSGDGAAVIDALKASGLRGMGGAGFPAGAKWDLVRQAPGEVKYVICNADESEPGTFKDRFILQMLPDLVLEGMALAAVAVGARKAVIYIRHEYARQRDVLLKTLKDGRRRASWGPT